MKIESVEVNIIRDSREQETLEARIIVDNTVGVASVPSGKSRSSYEARVLNPDLAVKRFKEEVGPELKEKNFNYQDEFDNWLIKLDGTEDKSRLGGNLILALSLAWARVKAGKEDLELFEYINKIYRGGHKLIPLSLPRLIMNMVNGGLHTAKGLKDVLGHRKPVEIQEFQIIPQQPTIEEGFKEGRGFYKELEKRIEDIYPGEWALGDEAGYSAPWVSNEQVLALLKELAQERVFNKQYSFDLAVDVAGSSFYKKDKNIYRVGEEELTPKQMIDYMEHLIHKYGLVGIEDPFYEDAWHDFAELNKRKGVYVVTDDLTSTNPHRLQMAINNEAGDAIIIKPNQIGSLTETIEVAKQAHKSGWQIVVSHRSGETEDNFIADLAVGLNAWGIKVGAPATTVRLAKYHRLLEIEEIINK